jgi:hypothetical protein
MTAVSRRIPRPDRDDESAVSFGGTPKPSSPPQAPPPPVPSDWQPQLITMLAELEHLLTSLEGKRLSADAAFILPRVESMVHAAEELAGRTTFANNLMAEQTEAIARAGQYFMLAVELQKKPTSGLKSFWASLTGNTPTTPAPAVREALVAAVDALNAYFALFTSRFGSSKAASGWVDAASTFLAEFRRLTRELPD